MAAITLVEEELTPEGRQMWNNLINLEKLSAGKSLLPERKMKKLKLNMFEIELMSIRTWIRQMIKNSEMVIADCNAIVAQCSSKEEYLSCDAKTAKLVHQNLIVRLQKILDLQQPFDNDIQVEEEPKRYLSKENKE